MIASCRNYRNAFWFLVAAFCIFSAAAGAGWLRGADFLALRLFQLPASGALDGISGAVSVGGGIFLTTALAAVLVTALYLRGRDMLAFRLAVAFVAASVVEVLLKLFLPVPPLPEEYLRAGGEETWFTFPHPYPSGHMMRSFFLAGALALLRPSRVVGVVVGVFLVAMAVTRVYLGVHWASDVVGGVLLGAAALAWSFGPEGTTTKSVTSKARVR